MSTYGVIACQSGSFPLEVHRYTPDMPATLAPQGTSNYIRLKEGLGRPNETDGIAKSGLCRLVTGHAWGLLRADRGVMIWLNGLAENTAQMARKIHRLQGKIRLLRRP